MRYNGLESRFTLYHGDLRDPAVLANEEPFDLVTGSPPYFPTRHGHSQAIPARIEVRGSVADYARTAARILAPGGLFAFVFPTLQLERALAAVDERFCSTLYATPPENSNPVGNSGPSM